MAGWLGVVSIGGVQTGLGVRVQAASGDAKFASTTPPLQRACTKESTITNFATQVRAVGHLWRLGTCEQRATQSHTMCAAVARSQPTAHGHVTFLRPPSPLPLQDTKDGWTRFYAPLSAFECVNKGDYGVRAAGGSVGSGAACSLRKWRQRLQCVHSPPPCHATPLPPGHPRRPEPRPVGEQGRRQGVPLRAGPAGKTDAVGVAVAGTAGVVTIDGSSLLALHC